MALYISTVRQKVNELFITKEWDVIVIGSGPAGLASAVSAHDGGASVCIIEREERPGGILKQCIHEGFGVIRFEENLTGPEYACRYIDMARERNIPIFLNSFLTEISYEDDKYRLVIVNKDEGIYYSTAPSIVAAMGCRERTAKQVFIHGSRPSGVFTAGLAQYFINIQGYMPTKRSVILGSGDIGLIMARRLTLEGAEVLGVYEIKGEASGLTRNVVQCLDDYNIPLHLNTTVKDVHGKNRVEGVTICKVDNFKPVSGTEEYIECDSLILSVGLIPENDIIEGLDVEIDEKTLGPFVDHNLMTMKEGVFSCGNALHVNDLVDYVSESGDIAGMNAALFAARKIKMRNLVPLRQRGEILYTVPQFIDINSDNKAIIYFRSLRTFRNARLRIYSGEKEYISKKYRIVKPPEMEKLTLDLSRIPSNVKEITVELEEEN